MSFQPKEVFGNDEKRDSRKAIALIAGFSAILLSWGVLASGLQETMWAQWGVFIGIIILIVLRVTVLRYNDDE